MRPVLIGIEPGNFPGEPLAADHPSGKRLCDLASLSPTQYLEKFDRVNLHPFHGAPLSLDRRAARNLIRVLQGRRVIALGGRVARAMGVPDDMLCWGLCEGFVGSWAPHPSGLNRWWNNSRNYERARKFFRQSTLPCVCVEGPDGSGKTTLVEKILHMSSWNLVPTENPPRSWDECLQRINRRIAPGSLCDRMSGLISELVYGPLLRGKTLTKEADIWEIARAVSRAITVIYCRPPLSFISPTFREDEDPTHVEKVKQAFWPMIDKYDSVISKLSRIGFRVLWYDWTSGSVNSILKRV